MVKTLLAALVVGGVTFAIVAGCGADTSGTSVKNGSKSKGDDDDDTTPAKGTSSGSAGTSSGSAVAADCTKLEPADPRPACDTCARSKCCNEYAACENNADCKALKACTDPLASDDIVGILGCQGAHESGGELGQTFGSCIGLNCKAECPDTNTKGDGGTDPFGDDDDAG